MLQFDYVIVGGGPAGLGALASLPADASAVLLEARETLMYTLTWMNHVPYRSAGGKTGAAWRADLLGTDGVTAARGSGRIRTGVRVFSIDREARVVHARSDAGEHLRFGYGTVVVAVGATQIMYGDYLLPGIRGGRFFTAYQVQEMLHHFDFLPGRSLVVYGTSEYAIETALAARAAGLTATVISPDGLPNVDGLPETWHADVTRVEHATLKQVYGHTRFAGVLLQDGAAEHAVPGDALAVDGKLVLEHQWRHHLEVEWDLEAWHLDLGREEMAERNLFVVGDAYRPSPDFVRQYREAAL